MSRLSPKKLITPQSVLIEQTAAEMAAVFWEAGRSAGMPSRFKNARAFARAKMTTFIPKAVQHLIEVLGNSATTKEMKDLIYEAIMERVNDPDLSNSGIKAFEVPIEYKSDKYIAPAPLIINTKQPTNIKKNSLSGTSIKQVYHG